MKELNEIELTDDEVVNLYNACDYDKFVNLIGALESVDVLNCSNANEMIRKLTILIWCHYENSVDTDIIDNIIDGTNVMTTLDGIASHLKGEEDTESECEADSFDDLFDNSPFDDSNLFGNRPFDDSLIAGPFDNYTFGNKASTDILDENTNEDSDKQKEIKKAYKKLEKAIDILKDIISGD